jgi:Ca2+-binding EF-hand superfamily protein
MKSLDKEEALRVDVTKALNFFDFHGNGYISVADLRKKLTTVGDKPLMQKEVDTLVAQLPVTIEGEVPLAELVKLLMKRYILFCSA